MPYEKVIRLGMQLTLVALLIGCGVAWRGAVARADKLAAENATLAAGLQRAQAAIKRNDAIVTRLRATNAATARSKRFAEASLNTAAQAHVEWAQQPVPKEVQDALP